MSVYYNEIDPYCAQWLRNLMDAGLIPCGDIDTRSIEDVIPNELREYTQCHFFAGLGGWPYALQLAGWGTRPVWTGSCPCQPFSAAGKGAGFDDERHLWPAWQHLIEQCRPAIVFGEQVASKDADAWIDLVHADLEGMGYAFGCLPFPAAGIGAPHIRDRNYWVADTAERGRRKERSHAGRCLVGDSAQGVPSGLVHGIGIGRMADADGWNASAEREQRSGEQRQQPQDGGVGGMAESHGECAGIKSETIQARESKSCRHSEPIGLHMPKGVRLRVSGAGPTNGQWGAADWLACTDGKWRPVEPGTFPLAHGLPNRVGRLRAYGNAIVPQAAAAFITAYMQARGLIGDQQKVDRVELEVLGVTQ